MHAAQSSVGNVLSICVILPPMVGCFLDDIDLETRVRDIERGLNARDAAADDKRPLRNGAGSGGQRRVELHLCDRGSCLE